MFNAGVDLAVSTSSVPFPLSGYARLFNASLLPSTTDSYTSSGNYSASNTIVFTPAETSYVGVYVLISNLVPASDISGAQYRFFTAGDTIGTPQGDYVHVEVIKGIGGVGYRLDPTSYLQPRLEPNVSVALECNDVVIRTRGVVVERVDLVDPSELIRRELLGEPLVVGKE